MKRVTAIGCWTMNRTRERIEIFEAKDIVQPSSIALISLWDWCDPAFYGVDWHNKRRRFDPRNLGIENRFKTQEEAIEFARKFGFGGYRIEGRTTRLR